VRGVFPTPPSSAGSARRLFWLDAAAILVFAVCVFVGLSLSSELILATGAALFLPILWLALVALTVLVYLLVAAWNRWRRRQQRTPLALGRRLGALVLLAGSVPLAALSGAWVAYWRAERALQTAFEHCERLVEEMEQHHAHNGNYPRSLTELPSGEDLPTFVGHVEYEGGGPSQLSIQDDRNLTPLIWSFDPAQGTWSSWDPF